MNAILARKKKVYQVKSEDRQELESLLRSHNTPQSLVLRAKILSLCDAGKPVDAVAAELETTLTTAHKSPQQIKFGAERLRKVAGYCCGWYDADEAFMPLGNPYSRAEDDDTVCAQPWLRLSTSSGLLGHGSTGVYARN